MLSSLAFALKGAAEFVHAASYSAHGFSGALVVSYRCSAVAAGLLGLTALMIIGPHVRSRSKHNVGWWLGLAATVTALAFALVTAAQIVLASGIRGETLGFTLGAFASGVAVLGAVMLAGTLLGSRHRHVRPSISDVGMARQAAIAPLVFGTALLVAGIGKVITTSSVNQLSGSGTASGWLSAIGWWALAAAAVCVGAHLISRVGDRVIGASQTATR